MVNLYISSWLFQVQDVWPSIGQAQNFDKVAGKLFKLNNLDEIALELLFNYFDLHTDILKAAVISKFQIVKH